MEVDSSNVNTSTSSASNSIEDHASSKRRSEDDEKTSTPPPSSSATTTNTEHDEIRNNNTDPLINITNGSSIATLSSLALLPSAFPNIWSSILGTMNPPPDETVVKLFLNNASLMAPPFGSALTGVTPKGKTPSATTYPKKSSTTNLKKDASNSNQSTSAAGATDRGSKGLKHFSLKVCEKVQNKGTTTYNDVANELVNDYVAGELTLGDDTSGSKKKKNGGEEKNIRRRVYDALNVLMALKIITKEKKEIKWKGFPVNYHQEYDQLMAQKKQRLESIHQKTAQLEELKKQRNASRNLFDRNKEIENDENSQVMLPFIIVHTGKDTIIECEMDEEGTDLFFNFSLPFEIHDDNEILYRLDLDKPSPAQVMEDEMLVSQIAQLIQQSTPQNITVGSSSSANGHNNQINNSSNSNNDGEDEEDEDKDTLSEEEEEEVEEKKPSKSKKSSKASTAASSKKKRGRKSKSELTRVREEHQQSASESGAETSSSQPSQKRSKKDDRIIELSDEE